MEQAENTTKIIIKSRNEVKINIQNSIFIGSACFVENREEAQTYLTQIREKYPDATHIVYAIYIKGIITQYSDDHEPAGTAGIVLYNEIISSRIDNVVLVVVRYFGRKKLGIRGLINAYRNTAKECLKANPPVLVMKFQIYELFISDSKILNQIQGIVRIDGGMILEKNFAESIRLKVAISNISILESFVDRIRINYIGEQYN